MTRLIKIKSFSRPEVYHIVYQNSEGKWICDCEYFKYKGYKENVCDHILKARHKKLRFHARKVLRLKAVKRAIGRYNTQVTRYRITEDRIKMIELYYPKRLKIISNLKLKLKKYKKGIKYELKKYPEIIKLYKK